MCLFLLPVELHAFSISTKDNNWKSKTKKIWKLTSHFRWHKQLNLRGGQDVDDDLGAQVVVDRVAVGDGHLPGLPSNGYAVPPRQRQGLVRRGGPHSRDAVEEHRRVKADRVPDSDCDLRSEERSVKYI